MPILVEAVGFDMPPELQDFKSQAAGGKPEDSASGDCVATLTEEQISDGGLVLLSAGMKTKFSAGGDCAITSPEVSIDGAMFVDRLGLGAGTVLGNTVEFVPVLNDISSN